MAKRGVRINLRRKKKNKKAPAMIAWSSATNDRDKVQKCIFATCLFSDQTVGPIWGHSDATMRRALATLTKECECPSKFHQAREFKGMRVV